MRQPVRKKIDWILLLIQTHIRVPEKYLKHLSGTDGLYEIRIQAGNDIFRIFCFFDSGRLIVLMNGFQKKTMKTPVTEIEKAERIKKQYENAR
ncbi:type II toxin-antitoxin system RelE/ParE family toxin [Mucilaginibacter oryzae]|uniref:type II toxin-antitoxin system RelE/ParE family toxin n=1 Tax=Mucilaginibacter oryzae TaxID=468058 RepID=UPI000D6C41D8|nr:type II toxin-antitoxin system RelE/ParE family toxin [Mucilaginibacter oryzae]